MTFTEYYETFINVEKRTPMFLSQKEYVSHSQSQSPIDFIGKFESYDESAQYLLNKLNIHNYKVIPNLSPGGTNVKKNISLSEILTPENRAMIKAAYREDFEEFNYSECD